MEMSTEGGLEKMINKIISTKDTVKIIAVFKDLIAKSYGEKSADGKRFIKSKDLTEAFMQTEAYSDLFMELATNTKSAEDFVNGVTPKFDNTPSVKPALVTEQSIN